MTLTLLDAVGEMHTLTLTHTDTHTHTHTHTHSLSLSRTTIASQVQAFFQALLLARISTTARLQPLLLQNYPDVSSRVLPLSTASLQCNAASGARDQEAKTPPPLHGSTGIVADTDRCGVAVMWL